MMVDSAIAAISSFRVWDNRDWDYEYLSTGCEELFGYTVQELMADKNLWLSQVFPEDREPIVMPMLEAFFAQRNTNAEYRFNHKDGSIRWISSNYACQKIEGNSWTIAGVHQDISDTATATLRDRKQAEAEARQTEAEFRAMFNQIGVGMAQVDMKTRRILRANAAFCGITGYSEAELLALTVDDLNHPDDRDLLHGDSYQSEKRYLRKDGSAIDVEVTVSAFMEAGKQFNLVLIKDITEVKRLEASRQQAETAVQESHQQMLAIWESITDAYTMLDLEWRIVYANPTSMAMMSRLANLEPEEILGKSHWELFPWTVGHTIEREYRRAIAQQVPVHLEVLYEPTGNWFEVHAYPSPVGLGLYFRDISDRKQLEIALQSSEEKLRLALDLNTIGIWEWNIGTGVVFWNASHYIVLGYQPGAIEPSYQRWRDRVHPDDIEFAEQRIIQALETHTDYEAELRLLLDDGSIRWLHSKGRAIYDEQGQPLRMVGVEYDISDRKQAEAALRHNQEMFSALVENAPFGIYLIDAEFRLQRINQGAEAVFSNIDPLIGRDFAEILRIVWQEPFATEAIDRFRHTFATGESYYSPVIVEQRANIDEIQAYDWQIHRLVLPDGSDGVVCYFYDLSEIKRAEEIIRRTAQRDAFLVTLSDTLRPLADPMEVQATATRILGEYLGANRALYFEVRGSDYVVERDYVNGADTLAGIYPIAAFGQSLVAAYRSGRTVVQPDVSADPSLSPDQKAAYAAIAIGAHIGIPLIKGGEFVAGLAVHMSEPRAWTPDEVALVEEVASRTWAAVERTRAEEALREQQRFIENIVATTPNTIYILDIQEHRHIYASRDGNADLGYTKEDYQQWGSNFLTRILHPDDRQRLGELFGRWETASDEDIFEAEIRVQKKDGTWVWHWLREKVFLRDADGRVRQIIGTAQDITVKKQAELALQESEQKLNLFVRNAPVSVAMFDRNMNYIAVSQRWVDAYQLGTIDAVLGHSQYEVMPDIPERWRQVHQRCLAGAVERCDEDQFTLPDGSIEWVRWEVQPWRARTGEIGGILIFAEEITDRKQAELMHQQQIEREQAIADIAQDIRRSLDLNEVLSRTVERVRHLLNTDRVIIFRFLPDWQGEVVVESVGAEWKSILSTTIFDPCFRDRYIEPYRQGRISSMSDINAEDIEPCYVELLKPFQVKANLVIPLLPGEQLWGLLIAHQCSAPRQWQNGEIELMQQLANQVSIAIQQSELYQKIREQAALIDIATDAIFVRDLDNCILFWNQGAEGLYGWTVEEALGKTAAELFDRESASQLAENLHITIEKGFWQGELEQFTKSGKEVKIASRWTLVRDESAQPKSILVVNSNITEKKQLEKQFYRAQRLESIGTLASGIAHDFNNILTPILGISHLLPMKFPNLDEQTRQLLEILEVSANRGASLVKQVLSFSRGQEGKRVILQVEHLLSEVVTIANRTFPKSIQISANIPRMELWTISADTTQIHQVLMNLIVNARDAMPNGGSLTISAENSYLDENYTGMNLEAQIGSYVMVTISDTGIGIPPELLERIFDPFFTTKEVGKGTGLGLATVMGIVKNHGGFVRVYSEMGNGTQFQVYLPASEGRLNQPILEEELPIGNGELILIVDDEPTIRQIAKTSLEKYNYRTLFASDGIEALSLYAQHQEEISVVLIDMMMPNLDGLTAIRALQKMNSQVKAIATSGLAANSQLAFSVNVKTFLLKPYTLKDLLTALHEVISTTNSQTD